MPEPETLRSFFAYAGWLYRHGLTIHHKAVSFFCNKNEVRMRINSTRKFLSGAEMKLREFYMNDRRVPD